MHPDHPAFIAFEQGAPDERVWGQVGVWRQPGGYELRHIEDAGVVREALNRLAPGELRGWAQTTRWGEFRPLKSAPNLRSGWFCEVAGSSGLCEALDALYPGSVADWHAVACDARAGADYREVAGRQTGMYRVVQKLQDAEVVAVAEACCAPESCLKQRRWRVGGEQPEPGKNAIPCLEPCPVFLEFARTVFRNLQAPRASILLSAAEVDTLRRALSASGLTPVSAREADFGDPLNPRVVRYLRARLSEVAIPPMGGG